MITSNGLQRIIATRESQLWSNRENVNCDHTGELTADGDDIQPVTMAPANTSTACLRMKDCLILIGWAGRLSDDGKSRWKTVDEWSRYSYDNMYRIETYNHIPL